MHARELLGADPDGVSDHAPGVPIGHAQLMGDDGDRPGIATQAFQRFVRDARAAVRRGGSHPIPDEGRKHEQGSVRALRARQRIAPCRGPPGVDLPQRRQRIGMFRGIDA
jgi:hypothetical protein